MPSLSPHEPLTLAELASLLHSKEAVRLSPAAEQHLGTHPEPRSLLTEEAPATENLGSPQESASLLTALAVGTGPELPAALVRRLLLLAAYRLGRTGEPGAAPLVRRLLDFYNREVWPLVYEQGSLGAGHDQIPLAHLALPLLGLGEVNYQGYRLAAADVLELFGWGPPPVSPALALGLLSGSAFTLAYATEVLARAEHLLQAAAVIGALVASPTTDLASLPAVRLVLETALNAPSEPAPTSLAELLTPPSAPAALDHALSQLGRTVAQAGAQSAQRVAELVTHAAPRATPPFGLLALPRAAASLVQLLGAALSNEHLPAAVSGGAAALGARRAVELAEQLLGLELLVVAQALDLREPAAPDLGPAPSPALLRAVAAFREHVTFAVHDRVLAPDLHRAARFVREHAWA